MLKKYLYSFFFLSLFFFVSGRQVSAATYYISPSGSDTQNGSQQNPFQTFQKAISALSPGDTLKVFPGTYHEKIVINTSGNANAWITISPVSERPVIDANFSYLPLDVRGDYLKISGLEIREGKNPNENDGYCINVADTAQHVIFDSIKLHECKGHGINIDGQNITFQNGEVYNTNQAFAHTGQNSGWGSGIKGHFGAENLTIKNNTVYNNYGEGIAVTRVLSSVIENNTAYDNFGVNIYVDNSPNTIVRNNFTYYTANSEYYKDGKKGRCIELAEEYYDGWGAQMNQVEVYNNIATDCYYGITFFDGGQSGSAIRNISIHHNTLWNIERTGTSIDPLPTQGTNEYYKNIVYSTRGVDIWTDLTAGIQFSTNLWVSGEPDVTIAQSNSDQYGQPDFITTPSYSDPMSYKLVTNSDAFQAGIGAYQTGFSQTIGATNNPAVTPEPTPSISPSPTASPLPPESCAEDITQDGKIDIQDYTVLISNFFSSNPSNPRSDINQDGTVNIIDYTLLAGRFFDKCE